MDAHDDCAAPVEALHEVELPQRPVRIERCAHQLAHQRLQLHLATSATERNRFDVGCDVEIGVGFPISSHRSLNDSLAKSREAKKTLGKQ